MVVVFASACFVLSVCDDESAAGLLSDFPPQAFTITKIITKRIAMAMIRFFITRLCSLARLSARRFSISMRVLSYSSSR